MQGRYLSDGNLFVDTLPIVPGAVAFWGGLAYNLTTGALKITTTLSGTDVYVAGKRVAANGALVVGNFPPNPFRSYNAGQGFDRRDGSYGRQINQVPAASDPFINGSREGPNGSCYMNTIGPPVTP